MRKSMMRILGVLLVLSASVLVAVPGYAFSDEFNRTYPLRAGGSFELQNVNGSVEVSGWDRDEVQVQAVKTAKRNREDLDRVTVEVTSHPDAVSVATRYQQEEGIEVAVEYRIHLPRNAQLRLVSTVNGNLHISGVENAGELRSVNGNVELFDSAGTVRARTTNGNLHLELHRVDAAGVTAETVNGSILIALPADAGADLMASSLNGDFRSELPMRLEDALKSREVRGQIGAGGTPIRVRTVNGGIRVVALRSAI